MEIKKLNETKEKLVILIKDTDHEFINTLRRIILTDVPTLAIKSVSIKKNNSNLLAQGAITLLFPKLFLKKYSAKNRQSAFARVFSRLSSRVLNWT